jgi:hypothetical protein
MGSAVPAGLLDDVSRRLAALPVLVGDTGHGVGSELVRHRR